MVLFATALFLVSTITAVNSQMENVEIQDHSQQTQDGEHLVDHLTEFVDLGGQGLRHIQEHLSDKKEFPKDGQFAEDIQAIENGDDTKGIFYFFELHDFDKNNKLDGLELLVALTDHHEKTKEENGKELLEVEVESLIDNLLEEHDLNNDGYLDFVELMNTGPDSLWNKLGKP
ncbi:multiple coagulation factor deficiency protein 2 homolog [Dendronephthya gigantea]|uniref:multiple coagulation factor deficiency protein 2 homolog n=1 Tax=Dendronephthya gigantea TaxID=151771 RepID=UPI00106D9D24|nr:multiple coagulation factor deficiency protein 2 homolog [Dendronephthya gigantea]